MAKVLALTHVECEGPGLWGEFLDESGISLDRVRLNDGEAMPALSDYDAVIVFGGPMNAMEDTKYPWLGPEKAAVAEAIRSGQPVIGFCLGSQITAASLGARVMKNPVKEIGWDLVTLTQAGRDDPLFSGLSPKLGVFQWHGDTFEIPDNATCLAKSSRCRNQAFRFGERAYALQFHVEVTPDMVEEWVDEYMSEAQRELPSGGHLRIVRQGREIATEMRADSRRIFDNWLEIAGLR